MTKMYGYKRILTVLLLSSCCFSCGDIDLFDSDKMSDSIEWDPDFVVPVGQGTFTMWDLLNPYDEDSTLITRDNRIIINYEEKDIVNLSAKDFWNMPEQHIAFGSNLKIPYAVNGVLPDDIVIFDAGIKSFDFGEDGEILTLEAKIKLSCDLPVYRFDYTLVFTMPDVFGVDGNPFEIRKQVTSSTPRSFSESHDVVFDMEESNNQFKYGVTCVILKGQNVHVSAGEVMKVDFLLSDVVSHKVIGNIHPPKIDIEKGDFSMDVDFWNDIQGDFRFEDPILKLVLKTQGVQLPVSFMPAFTAYDGKKKIDFVGEPLSFTKFSADGITENVGTYTKSNSNVADFISLPPRDSIVYGGDIWINQDRTREDCVVEENALVTADLKVEVPLYFSAKNLTFRDTIKDIDFDKPDQIKKLSLQLRAKNGTPLAISVDEFLMVDDAYHVIDHIIADKLIDAPDIDKQGNVVAIKESVHDVVLSEGNIRNISRMKHLILVAKMVTSGGGEIPAEVKADAHLELVVLAKVKLGAK